MGDWKRANLIELGHSSAEKQASRWFFCIAEWVTLIFHFYSGSTRRGRPHTWAVDSHSRICTIQGP